MELLQSPSEGIWCALRDLLLQTPMQSSHPLLSSSPGVRRRRRPGPGNKAAGPSLCKISHQRKRKRLAPAPRAHAAIRLHGSHTMMATCISSSRCVGRDNVLTKAVGWKFANSGAHALDYSGTALGTCSVAACTDRFRSPRSTHSEV